MSSDTVVASEGWEEYTSSNLGTKLETIKKRMGFFCYFSLNISCIVGLPNSTQ